MKTPIENKDIIDFRRELIERTYSKTYNNGVVCNDGKTNVMTEERRKVMEDVLIMFNNHFTIRGYNIG